ncbi:MAG: VRR-NUC domain-containing protein [Prevotella sp.]|nr:VRR-NUC domain-containing protein [Prevotella sp.]
MKDLTKSIKRLVRHAEEGEKSIESYLSRRVRETGGLCLKFTSQVDTGYPDRLLLLPGGRTAWVEVKSRGEKPRRLQVVRMERLVRLGFAVHVVDSREKVDRMLEGLATAGVATAEPSPTEKPTTEKPATEGE